MLEELAGDIGFAVNSFRQKEQVADLEKARIENYQQTIRSFADMIDQRDTFTAGHTVRVAEYSRLLATQMGLAKSRSTCCSRRQSSMTSARSPPLTRCCSNRESSPPLITD